MNDELVKQYEDNTKAIMATEEQITSLIQTQQTQLRALQKRDSELKTAIKEAMEANNVKKFENDFITITYVAPVDRTIVDSKRMREENPELFDKYSKISKVSSSVRIKVKTEDEV